MYFIIQSIDLTKRPSETIEARNIPLKKRNFLKTMLRPNQEKTGVRRVKIQLGLNTR